MAFVAASSPKVPANRQLDLADLIAKRLPLIIGVVVALSMLLLLIAFRSG
jgi:hypothetical protein